MWEREAIAIDFVCLPTALAHLQVVFKILWLKFTQLATVIAKAR